MKTYLEFKDNKSYKFWQIELDGISHKVTFGKIGTAGQSIVKEFDSPEQARKDAENLINSKLKKGYERKENDNPTQPSTTKKIAINDDEIDDGLSIIDKIKEFLADPAAQSINELIIGFWGTDASPDDSSEIVSFLAEHAQQLPLVKHIFIGDISSEESEISWINQSNLTPLLNAFPTLESLKVRGSNNLSFTNLQHPSLKSLVIESGGLGKNVLNDIANARLPQLEHLELFLGIDHYGFDASINDIKPLLQKGLFPNLKYLGLRNSEISDEIAKAICSATILEQLDVLDLSLGTLTDKGAKLLLKCPAIQKLKKLDLHWHYMSEKIMNQLNQIGIPVNTDDIQTPINFPDGTTERYPQITE